MVRRTFPNAKGTVYPRTGTGLFASSFSALRVAVLVPAPVKAPNSPQETLQKGTEFWGHGDLSPEEMEVAKVKLYEILFEETLGRVAGLSFWDWVPGSEITFFEVETEKDGEKYRDRIVPGRQGNGPMNVVKKYYELITATKGKPLVYRSGDLVISGRKTRTIEGSTLFIDGNIIVKGRGKLTIDNARIIVNNTYKGRYSIRLRNYAEVKIIDSVIEELHPYQKERFGKPWFTDLMFSVEDKASLTVENSKCWARIDCTSKTKVISSSVAFIYWNPSGKVTVTNSWVGKSIPLCFKRGKSEVVELTGLRPGTEPIDVSIKLKKETGFLELRNTVVQHGWEMELGTKCHKHIILKNSHFQNVWVSLPRVTGVKGSGLTSGFYKDFQLSKHI